MKKFLLLILFLVPFSLFLSGCGSDKDKIKVGTIKYLNVTETALAEIYGGESHEYIFFDNMNAMAAALNSGQIDEISTYESVAEYIELRNGNIDWTMTEPELTHMFCCAMLKDDSDLKKEFDDAISNMTADGTLAQLVKTYINDFTHDQTPKIIHMPKFDGAETIKIGVTGDLPLLDYISPDGVPAGFNTAVLAEISNRIKKNFMLVQVDSGARVTALSSEKVDVIFWAVVSEDKRIGDIDRPEGVIFTKPYFSDEIVHVKLGIRARD